MIEAFKRWIAAFGSRPWQDELQKAYFAGYRAGMKWDQTSKTVYRARNPNAKIKLRTKSVEPKRDALLERLKDQR